MTPQPNLAAQRQHHPRPNLNPKGNPMPKPPPYPHSLAGEYSHLPAYGAIASKLDRERKPGATKATSTPKPAPSKAKPFAGMSTAQILAGLSAEQSASLAAALVSTVTAGTSKRDPEADYQRGVANGRAAERTRVGKVYDQAKTQGGDAAALRMLATTDLDSAAIIGKLFGSDTSLVDAMRKRFEGGKA